MRRALPALAAVLVLAGCGSSTSGGSSLPTLETTTAPATTTPVVTPTATTPVVDPSPWTALPTRDVGPNKGVFSGVVLGYSVAKSPEEEAAAQAWVNFWAFIVASGDTMAVDKTKLGVVASGAAATNLQTFIADQRRKNRRTIGWMSLNVTDITVGSGATLLSGCLNNGTYDVDARTGARLEQGSAAADVEAAVRIVNGRLVVTSSGVTRREARCPVPKG